MASSITARGKGISGLSPTLSFAVATAGVVLLLWLAWIALTSDSVPVVGTARNALIAIAIVGMAACAIGGIGQAPIMGWTHPLTILGIAVGVLALVIVGAGLFGWDTILSPFAGFVPVGSTLAATSERVAIGLLVGLIVVKWIVGIPWALLGQQATPVT
jgi:hypothetical protein